MQIEGYNSHFELPQGKGDWKLKTKYRNNRYKNHFLLVVANKPFFLYNQIKAGMLMTNLLWWSITSLTKTTPYPHHCTNAVRTHFL